VRQCPRRIMPPVQRADTFVLYLGANATNMLPPSGEKILSSRSKTKGFSLRNRCTPNSR